METFGENDVTKDKVRVIYLEKKDKKVVVEKDITYESIKNRLNLSSPKKYGDDNKVSVYCEDLEAFKVAKCLLHDFSKSLNFVNIKLGPTEIYNLAAQSHVQVSFDSHEFTADVDAVGVLRILEAVRTCGLTNSCRIYQASTSELYGMVEQVPQSERTPFHPYSPYAVAKQYGYWIVKEYRNAYGMFACNGILFNHESERRGETFVTRKITLAAARIKQGKQDKLLLGSLDSLRDWGYARDYVECMWLILQNSRPDDFVIATGVQHTVREFATLAFHDVGIELEWQGKGINEKGIDRATGKTLVEVSPDFYRPTDVVNLLGDPSKARRELGWNPSKTPFEELVRLMWKATCKRWPPMMRPRACALTWRNIWKKA